VTGFNVKFWQIKKPVTSLHLLHFSFRKAESAQSGRASAAELVSRGPGLWRGGLGTAEVPAGFDRVSARHHI
jgi:hypothetical protein